MPYRPLNQVSDLFFAIGDAIHAAGLGVDVANYDDFDGTVGHAKVLIELERTTPGVKQNDGRSTHAVTVTLHAVVGRWRKHAALEAANLATCLERLADNNRWGFHGRNCEPPCELHSGPSMFQRGADGYDAWGATFKQVVTPGEPPAEIRLNAAPLVAFSWRVDDLDNPENYHQLET
ncbi:TPA: hypothetical protein NHP34_006055 [Pseudomonas aeruginosa]|nr:hypothetical protein [Pseudomonas aeruginosa]